MKPMTKALIAAGLLSASAVAQAGLSANVGAASDYWFRGFNVSEGPMLSGGVDYEAENGVYAGLWAAGFEADHAGTVPTSETNELEYDLYVGYAGEVEDFSYSVGYTGYFYKEGDTDFHELNMNFGYSFLSLEVTLGETDGPISADDQDYSFVALTGEYEGAYLTYGTYGKDADGDYVELGYGTTYEGLDFGVAYIDASDENSADAYTTDGSTVLFTIGKSFDF